MRPSRRSGRRGAPPASPADRLRAARRSRPRVRREAEEVRREHADRTRAEHQRPPEPHGWRPPIERVPDPALADRRRLDEHAQPTEGASGSRSVAPDPFSATSLPRESVQARDSALAVVAREAGVRSALAAGEAVRARAAHDRRDQVAAREAVPRPARRRRGTHGRARAGRHLRRHAEETPPRSPVGAADADLERPYRHLALADRRLRSFDARRVRLTGSDDERLHQAAVRPPSRTSTVPAVANSAETRYSTASATSSVVPSRPSGRLARSASSDSPASSTRRPDPGRVDGAGADGVDPDAVGDVVDGERA